MNAKNVLVASLILAVSSVTFAAQGASVTRDQVKAELAATLKTSHYDPISGQYVANQVERTTAGLSRDQVKAELAAVQKTQAYDTIHGHYVLSQPEAATRSRTEVKAELAETLKTSSYDPVSGQYVSKTRG